MRRTRRKFTSTFKTKVVLEALKERSTMQELSSKYEVHSNQITTWKKDFLNNAQAAFERKNMDEVGDNEKEKLFNKIGHMQVEIDFLKKVLGK